MSRGTHVSRNVLICLLYATVVATAACDGLFGDGGVSSTVTDDAGNCVKDREALSEILVQPQSCTTSDECPPGAFCNGDTGDCDWQCYTDSDCGFGATCTCDGMCVDGVEPDAGATGDPACPRNTELLTSTIDPIQDRSCTRDEHCPYGARCDIIVRRCAYDCLTDADCAAPGTVCDCRGACVVPGSQPSEPVSQAPRVTITPEAIVVPPGNTWGKQTISIHVAHPDPLAGAGYALMARVEARDPDNLGAMGIVSSEQIAETGAYYAGIAFSTSEDQRALYMANNATLTDLQAAGIPYFVSRQIEAGSFLNLSEVLALDGADTSTLQALKTATEVDSSICTSEVLVLQGPDWVIDQSEGYEATASVSVERCAATEAYPRNIAVSVYFADPAAGTPLQHLDSRSIPIDTANAPSLEPTLLTGEFEGTVTQQNAVGEPLVIPVRAWATGTGGILFFDDLHIFSASGYFELISSGPTYVATVAQDSDGDAPGAEAVLTAELDNWVDEPLTLGGRTGAFELRVASAPSRPQTFRYDLRRTGDDDHPESASTPCSAGCQSGSICANSIARCVESNGVPHVSSLQNTLTNDADEWRAAAGFLHDANQGADIPANQIEKLLCYDYESLPSSRPLGDSSWLSSTSQDLQCVYSEYAPFPHLFEYAAAQTAVGLVTGWQRWGRASGADPTPEAPIISPPTGASAWLSECLQDLSRPVPEISNLAPLQDRVENWFGAPGPCVNLAQLFPAFGLLIHDQIDGNNSRYLSRRDALLFQRLLAMWLDVNAFVMQQGIEVERSTRHLELVSGENQVTFNDLLARAEDGWDVVLDPDFANALRRLPRNLLASPDYRVPRPTAYWTFDAVDRSGGHFVDAAGEHHLDVPGTIYAMGDAVAFGQETEGTALAPGVLAPHGDITLSFWIHEADLQPGDSYEIFRYPHGLVVELFGAPGVGAFPDWSVGVSHGTVGFETSYRANADAWAHVLITREDRHYTVYINGAVPPGGTYDFSSADVQPEFDPYQYTYLLKAPILRIDDMAIWEKALSSTERYGVFQLPISSAGSRPLLEPLTSSWDPNSQDYKGDNPNAEQNLGVAVKIVETASKHANVIKAYATSQLNEVYDSCYMQGHSAAQLQAIRRGGKSLQYLMSVEALARDLHDRSTQIVCTGDLECVNAGGSACGPEGVCLDANGRLLAIAPEWELRYQRAFAEFAAARSAAVRELERLKACENPLGVPEDDLPLYFGEVDGPNLRYFASSDYLVDGWARPAVQTAITALADARTAWLNQRDGDIRQLMNEYEAERRLEALDLSYMQPVLDACGLNVDEVELDEIDVLTCYMQDCTGPAQESCYRGRLGEAALAVMAASKAILVEQRQSKRRLIEWEQQIEICDRTAAINLGVTDALDEYKQAAFWARQDTSTWGFFGNMFGGCFSGTLATGGSPVGCLVGAGLGAAASAAQNGSQSVEEARDTLNDALTRAELQKELAACYDEMHRRQRDWFFGRDVMMLRLSDYSRASLAFNEEVKAAQRQVAIARSVISREGGRTLPSVAHHHWVDEKVDRFAKEFERARRLTYLAMRAVEYEFQQSLGLRSEVLEADHPDALLDVIYALDAERATRSINSRRPSEGTEVLSLRTDILGLHSLYPPAPGERADVSSLRFQDILTARSSEIRDADGNYLGQGIRFSLAESGALRHRCGERLWRVTATIQGDLTDIDEPRAEALLLKRNVFKSQWCTGLGDGSRYQQASTAGGSNLFAADRYTVGRPSSEYTTALLYPWYNVRRSEFYGDTYTQGASEELAGRGLYGDYILLFPYHGMLEPDTDCDEEREAGCSDPFRELRKVEDVLIRFDYYSVDDLPDPAYVFESSES